MERNQNEVARLRAQIEAEHRAARWALTGLATGAAQHAFISRRMRHLDLSYQGLEAILGEQEAVAMLCEIWEEPTNIISPIR